MPRTTVFVSYSHADRSWLDRLQVHLAPFERRGLIRLWDDTRIKPGTVWREEIREGLTSARVAVLLLSADFLKSEFIADNELPSLLTAASQDGATVLQILVKPCKYQDFEELERLQMVNDPKHALVDLPEGAREQVFVDLANAVKASLDHGERGDDVRSPATGVAAATPNERRPTPWPAAMRHSVPKGLTVWGKVDEESLGRIRLLEFMNSTGHSVLQKCDLDGTLCVLKATRAELCDVNALAVLASGGPRPSPMGAPWNLDTMATPRAVWLHDDHVWELQEFYQGRSLAAIVEERRKPMLGAELSAVVNAIVDVLELLHGKGLVHRDVNPSNVLMLDDRLEFRIVDWSFCCLSSSKPSPVATPGYSAPEQERGAAECASDWYSLGATCFALANGFTVHERGPAEFIRGINKIQLDKGEFRGWPEEDYFARLLNDNPKARPAPWEGKNELFSIARASGALDPQERPVKSPFSWLSSLIRSVRQR